VRTGAITSEIAWVNADDDANPLNLPAARPSPPAFNLREHGARDSGLSRNRALSNPLRDAMQFQLKTDVQRADSHAARVRRVTSSVRGKRDDSQMGACP
jgi:hypothetical protein